MEPRTAVNRYKGMEPHKAMNDTPDADDDVTDEELAAALALIKKRRADAARQQEQAPAPVPVPRQEAAPDNGGGGTLSTPLTGPARTSLAPPVPGDSDAVWPPAPRPNAVTFQAQHGAKGLAALVPMELPAPVVGECPDCKRKLLTRTSALCNWCGAKINNDDYQEQAARTRQEMDTAVREAAAVRVQENTERGLLNRLKRRVKPGDTSNKAPQT